jgi:glutathione S-transferase
LLAWIVDLVVPALFVGSGELPGGTLVSLALYSFRRCPYAIRARLALAAAGLLPGRDLELREVSLKAKPPELLAASGKGTVPVLVAAGSADGAQGPAWLLEESLAIMRWALERQDREGWLAGWSAADRTLMAALIAENDGPFKHHLDRFKYPDRFITGGQASPEDAVAPASQVLRAQRVNSQHVNSQHVKTQKLSEHRRAGLAILRGWSARLGVGGWLLGDRPSLADWALLPFVRQFRLADPEGFDAEPGLLPLQSWLSRFLDSAELATVLSEPWASRSVWRSPNWLYHLALRSEWRAAREAGVYRRSTRGLSLDDVGFIHLSAAHQVAATAARFYGDLPAADLVLLVIDPAQLADAGEPGGPGALRWEQADPAPAGGGGELFPHCHGPLPLQAVLLAEPWQP